MKGIICTGSTKIWRGLCPGSVKIWRGLYVQVLLKYEGGYVQVLLNGPYQLFWHTEKECKSGIKSLCNGLSMQVIIEIYWGSISNEIMI